MADFPLSFISGTKIITSASATYAGPFASVVAAKSVITAALSASQSVNLSATFTVTSGASAALTVKPPAPPPEPVTPGSPYVFASPYAAQIIPSYLYMQYNDDQNLQSFVAAYNGATQTYLDWFNTESLASYTQLSGLLLDWIAQGLYGMARPTLASVGLPITGPVNTFVINGLTLNSGLPGTSSTYELATDDIFQRILTWHLYKSDGKFFSIPWLKRRVLRWILGTSGTAPSVANPSPISISISGSTVTIDLSGVSGISPAIISAFQYAVEGNLLELPPQYSWTVTT